MHPRVPLPCGGWITMEGTEALTAVDVNSGSFTHASGLEDAGLTVNLEAARELGRQLRLRGIGGLIVVDFMHMKEEAHVDRVLEALTQSLSRDGAPVTVSRPSPLGLVEITRKRVREPLVSLERELRGLCGAGQGPPAGRRGDGCLEANRRQLRARRRASRFAFAPRRKSSAGSTSQGERLRAALARRGAANLAFEQDATCSREGFDVATLP